MRSKINSYWYTGEKKSKGKTVFTLVRPHPRSFPCLFILFYQYSTSPRCFFLIPLLILVEMCPNRRPQQYDWRKKARKPAAEARGAEHLRTRDRSGMQCAALHESEEPGAEARRHGPQQLKITFSMLLVRQRLQLHRLNYVLLFRLILHFLPPLCMKYDENHMFC